MIAVDSNVLVSAYRRDAVGHERAAAALRDVLGEGSALGVPWPCVHEFLNIVTHPRVFDPPTPSAEALRTMQALREAPGTRLLGETARHLELLSELMRAASAVVGPKIHDARIAAICLGHGVTELWTADRDFSYFPSLRTRNPLVA